MIHFITMALGGEGYLNFMGNEVSTLASLLPAKLLVPMFSRTLINFYIGSAPFLLFIVRYLKHMKKYCWQPCIKVVSFITGLKL